MKVDAAGVNFIDVYKREGVYPMPTPFVLGEEFAGEVVAVGAGVSEVVAGQRVATTEAHGGMGEYAVAAANRVVPVPAGLDLDVACAAMLQGMTAHYLTTSTHARSRPATRCWGTRPPAGPGSCSSSWPRHAGRVWSPRWAARRRWRSPRLPAPTP